MGLYANVSRLMEDKVLSIMNKPYNSNIFKIEAMIYSERDKDLSIIPKFFMGWSIVHDFEKEYHEKISAVVNISMEEAMYIQAHPSNLRIAIVMNRVTQHYYRLITTLKPIIKNFIVLLDNSTRETLEKCVTQLLTAKNENNQQHKYTQDDIRAMRYPLKIEMVDDAVYEFSKRPLNSISKNTSMKAAIHYIANALNIKKVNMIVPDNETEYKHVFFPPFVTIEAIDKLQETRGIYTKGIGYYYFNQALYVYPEFDTNPKQYPQINKELHLYRLPLQAYPGCPSYSYEDESSLSIILVDPSKIVSISEIGAEINGNFITSKRTDTILDTDTEAKGKDATVKANNALSVASENSQSWTNNAVRMRYDEITNNPMAMSSSMASVMCGIMATQWQMAWPWSIYPGQRVVYYYDEQDAIQQASGIISGVEYNLNPVDGFPVADGTLMYYCWDAKLILRLTQELNQPQWGMNQLTANARQTMEANQKAFSV